MTDAPMLIQTKLFQPPVQTDLIPRPRLFDILSAHCKTRPLTIISAPAGYGKSVLASMWLESCDSPSGWVSLDKRDNDLRTFVSYLLAALKTAFPDITLETQALLEAPSLPPAPWLARFLHNDLAQNTVPFILALDDIHHIHEESIFDFLSELLQYSPAGMHLLLIGRQDPPLPVASLRAYRRVTEVRLRQLRFSTAETAALLAQRLQREIDEGLAAAWAERTEGWAVALHLAALSLQRRGTTDLGAGIRGDSRYLHHYLLAEVLGSLTPAKQAWLLKTSLLDRFCAPLCEAVCQEEGQVSEDEPLTGEAFIAWLRQASLFLIDLDDRDEWFRFHHLFQENLQAQLRSQASNEEIRGMHQRASAWYRKNDLLEPAVLHALAAGDNATAVDLFAQRRHQYMNEDNWNDLERCFDLFPEEFIANEPLLAISRAHIAVVRGRDMELVESRTWAERGVASLAAESLLSKSVTGEIAAVDAVLSVMVGQAANAIANGKRALELLPLQAFHLRGHAVAAQAIGWQMSGEHERGISILKETLANSTWPVNPRAKLLFYLCLANFMEGALVGAQIAAAESLRIAEKFQLWDTVSQARYFNGIISYLQNDFAQAETYLLALLQRPELSAPSYLAHAVCALARIYHLQERLEDAGRVLQMARNYLEEIENTVSLEIVRAYQVELALDQGDIESARALSRTVDFNMRPPIWFHYVPQLTPIRMLVAEGTDASLEQAVLALKQMDGQLSLINRNNVRIDVLALQALACDAQGDEQAAIEKLTAALDLGIGGRNIRCFADLGPPMADLLARLYQQGGTGMEPYLAEISASFPVEKQIKTARVLKDQLTKRELQTLRLLATDLSPHEIASELLVSVNTTRTHIRNIYRKLDVQSRYQAVEAAKGLGLL
jgi:LuxR family transcriptional regulator, maltose regulon positive regulatory protein